MCVYGEKDVCLWGKDVCLWGKDVCLWGKDVCEIYNKHILHILIVYYSPDILCRMNYGRFFCSL